MLLLFFHSRCFLMPPSIHFQLLKCFFFSVSNCWLEPAEKHPETPGQFHTKNNSDFNETKSFILSNELHIDIDHVLLRYILLLNYCPCVKSLGNKQELTKKIFFFLHTTDNKHTDNKVIFIVQTSDRHVWTLHLIIKMGSVRTKFNCCARTDRQHAVCLRVTVSVSPPQ